MKLTIAIPTYNRAKRLEKALSDLLIEINSSKNKTDISVFVSNNGSDDNTSEVIAHWGQIFIENGIYFSSYAAEGNQGFDANVIACYAKSDSEYIWFLSDDDNIINGAADSIVNDIKIYSPSVIYYNFDQKPYDLLHPYIKKLKFFEKIDFKNLVALKKIILWPKLSSLVIRKCKSGLEVPNHNSGFAHVTLALQCGLSEGAVLHSAVFMAYPDNDYKDHIDFVPYVTNNFDSPLLWVLHKNNNISFYEKLALPRVDPLATSLNTLGAFYRGRHVLTLPLKQELWASVRREIKFGWIKIFTDWVLVKEIIKFPISLTYAVARSYLRTNKLVKKENLD